MWLIDELHRAYPESTTTAIKCAKKTHFQTLRNHLRFGCQLVGTDSHTLVFAIAGLGGLHNVERSRFFPISYRIVSTLTPAIGFARKDDLFVSDLHTWHRVHFTFVSSCDDRVPRIKVTYLACYRSICRWLVSLSRCMSLLFDLYYTCSGFKYILVTNYVN